MKFLIHVLFISISLFILPVANADVKRLSDPVASDAQTETFGELFDTNITSTSLSALMTEPEKKEGEDVRITTRIAKVCQKKGCFFIAQEGEHIIRVSFKDYGFFIPTDTSGKTVELIGKLVKKTLSNEQATHFNEDLGGNNVMKPGDVFELVASSVKIPKSA
ncbi:DUF4920 domain-containing protein [Alteromonas sediminis]|uniref:DUF4920 domain-containing protein n=1 Tax=Alteromonas sediminis TaxID=2259342 RepID=UPI001F0C3177|nr:DUF4920 domain-containing protein [Alteromonas sediminis]